MPSHRLYILLIIVWTCIPSANSSKKTLAQFSRISSARMDTSNILDTFVVKKEIDCLFKCGRTTGCAAFNYYSDNGTCEVIPAVFLLGTPELPVRDGWDSVTTQSIPFVALPWDAGPRDRSIGAECWTWEWFDGSAPPPADTLILFEDSDITLGVVYSFGAYIPAQLKLSVDSYSVFQKSPFELGIRTVDSGYLFRNTSQCVTHWRSFTVGQTVPENAMVGGFDVDGSAVYVVRIPSTYALGHYHPGTNSALLCDVATPYENPDDMDILLVN